MNQLSFYIVTSDATSYILPATCYLYNKYWRFEGGQDFTILGNHDPKKMLPNNFYFRKIKDENDIQKWTRYLYDFISNSHTGNYFILTLDDYLPNTYLSIKQLRTLLDYARTHQNVGRIALGELSVESTLPIEEGPEGQLLALRQNAPYRLSCQTSIWNRKYFLNYFDHDWTPWELELKGSKLAKNDGWEIIGAKSTPFDWVEESGLSGRWPGMVNILGLHAEDVRYFIENKIFDPKKLQYGMWTESSISLLSRFPKISKKFAKIPKFSEIGYDFNWQLIKPYLPISTFHRLKKRYKQIYSQA